MIIFCLSVTSALAQTIEEGALSMSHDKATLFAKKSLGDFAQLVQQVDVRTLGFDTLEQALDAKLGQPITDVMIRLDELREYRTGDQAKAIMHATGRLIYPLEIDRKARSSMVLSLNESNNWTLESFGGAKQVSMITKLRKELANKDTKSEKEYYQVRVPALQLMFIGTDLDGTGFLSPLFDMPVYGLSKGEIYPASEVLSKLIDAARDHNGEPT
jgi:hypothetical protein